MAVVQVSGFLQGETRYLLLIFPGLRLRKAMLLIC